MTSFANSILKLAPANPIVLRVVTAGGRRLRLAGTEKRIGPATGGLTWPPSIEPMPLRR